MTTKTEVLTDGRYAYLIEAIEPINKSGVKVVFRTYSIENECGGFQTTLWIDGYTILNNAKIFVGSDSDAKMACTITGAKISSKKTNNVVPSKMRFEGVKSLIK